MSGPPGRTAMLRQHDEAALRIAVTEQLFVHICDRSPEKCRDAAAVDPPSFEAVTSQRTGWPTSAIANWYEDRCASAITVPLPRSQAKPYRFGRFCRFPVEHLRVAPTNASW